MRISDWSSDVCSSDLPLRPFSVAAAGKIVVATGTEFSVELLGRETRVILYEGHVAVLNGSAATRDTLKLFDEEPARSEEHTSELQSLMRISYAVFCLKKNKIKTQENTEKSNRQKKTQQ